MTLKTRVIPVLLLRGQEAVKGERFKSWRAVGSAINAVKIHNMRNIDELIVLDIAAREHPNFELIKDICSECFMPVTVGGGIRTVDHAVRLVRECGADKISINTMARMYPNMIKAIADKLGSQSVVVSIDTAKENWAYPHVGGVWAEDWAINFEAQGAGEVLLGNKDLDGTMKGLDIEVIEQVSSAVSIPVIASGGLSGAENAMAAITAGAHAVAAGALFQFTDTTPRGLAEQMQILGAKVRL